MHVMLTDSTVCGIRLPGWCTPPPPPRPERSPRGASVDKAGGGGGGGGDECVAHVGEERNMHAMLMYSTLPARQEMHHHQATKLRPARQHL